MGSGRDYVAECFWMTAMLTLCTILVDWCFAFVLAIYLASRLYIRFYWFPANTMDQLTDASKKSFNTLHKACLRVWAFYVACSVVIWQHYMPLHFTFAHFGLAWFFHHHKWMKPDEFGNTMFRWILILLEMVARNFTFMHNFVAPDSLVHTTWFLLTALKSNRDYFPHWTSFYPSNTLYLNVSKDQIWHPTFLWRNKEYVVALMLVCCVYFVGPAVWTYLTTSNSPMSEMWTHVTVGCANYLIGNSTSFLSLDLWRKRILACVHAGLQLCTNTILFSFITYGFMWIMHRFRKFFSGVLVVLMLVVAYQVLYGHVTCESLDLGLQQCTDKFWGLKFPTDENPVLTGMIYRGSSWKNIVSQEDRVQAYQCLANKHQKTCSLKVFGVIPLLDTGRWPLFQQLDGKWNDVWQVWKIYLIEMVMHNSVTHKQRQLLTAYEALGTVSSLQDRIANLVKYEKYGKVELLQNAMEKLQLYEKEGSLSEVQNLNQANRAYKTLENKIGTPENIMQFYNQISDLVPSSEEYCGNDCKVTKLTHLRNFAHQIELSFSGSCEKSDYSCLISQITQVQETLGKTATRLDSYKTRLHNLGQKVVDVSKKAKKAEEDTVKCRQQHNQNCSWWCGLNETQKSHFLGQYERYTRCVEFHGKRNCIQLQKDVTFQPVGCNCNNPLVVTTFKLTNKLRHMERFLTRRTKEVREEVVELQDLKRFAEEQGQRCEDELQDLKQDFTNIDETLQFITQVLMNNQMELLFGGVVWLFLTAHTCFWWCSCVVSHWLLKRNSRAFKDQFKGDSHHLRSIRVDGQTHMTFYEFFPNCFRSGKNHVDSDKASDKDEKDEEEGKVKPDDTSLKKLMEISDSKEPERLAFGAVASSQTRRICETADWC